MTLDAYTTHSLPIDEIFCDSDFNCRGSLVPIDVMDLVPDIKQRGLDTPITVRTYTEKPGKKYRIITGHRRFTACKLLEWKTIPAFIRDNLAPFEENIMNLTENIKRKDLNMLQEARGLIAFKKAKWREDIIAAQVGMSRGWVQIRLMLLELPEDVQLEAAAGVLNQDQIRKLYTVREKRDEMYAMIRLIKDRRNKGESTKITLKKSANPYRKELRSPEQMFELQDIIQKVLGNGFTTQVIGWCGGVNSDYEIHRALREEAERRGKFYEIPREILEKL